MPDYSQALNATQAQAAARPARSVGFHPFAQVFTFENRQERLANAEWAFDDALEELAELREGKAQWLKDTQSASLPVIASLTGMVKAAFMVLQYLADEYQAQKRGFSQMRESVEADEKTLGDYASMLQETLEQYQRQYDYYDEVAQELAAATSQAGALADRARERFQGRLDEAWDAARRAGARVQAIEKETSAGQDDDSRLCGRDGQPLSLAWPGVVSVVWVGMPGDACAADEDSTTSDDSLPDEESAELTGCNMAGAASHSGQFDS